MADKRWYYVILESTTNKSATHCYNVMAEDREDAIKQAIRIVNVEDNRMDFYPWIAIRVGEMEIVGATI